MANFVYTPAKSKLLSADLDLNSHDIRVALVMTNTTTVADDLTMSGDLVFEELL